MTSQAQGDMRISKPPARTLGALLLNPPLGNGVVSTGRVAVVAQLLACDTFQIANIFSIPTKSLSEVNVVGRSEDGWLAARPAILELLSRADKIVIGWGIGGLSGPARLNLKAQSAWIAENLRTRGLTCWSVSSAPRHPSRWHQYVSDRHGRAGSGPFDERLGRVLVELAPDQL